MQSLVDPTFYRSPAEAMAAAPERLAYVAAYDRAGRAKDALAVVDTDPASAGYGRVVGWAELPTAGNELHHFGWNACSSALCHPGHAGHGLPLERRYLVVPGLRSSRIYVLDTKPDPRQPQLVRTIEAEELAAKAGYSRPHTIHCGPGGILVFNLGGANGNDGPGGVALLDHDSFDVVGPWESDRGEQWFAYDGWWHLDHDTMITSEWATPSMVEDGLDPQDLLGRKFGHHYPGGRRLDGQAGRRHRPRRPHRRPGVLPQRPRLPRPAGPWIGNYEVLTVGEAGPAAILESLARPSRRR
jgi:methanethiol oxidase